MVSRKNTKAGTGHNEGLGFMRRRMFGQDRKIYVVIVYDIVELLIGEQCGWLRVKVISCR